MCTQSTPNTLWLADRVNDSDPAPSCEGPRKVLGTEWQRTLLTANPNGVAQFSCHLTPVILRALGPPGGNWQIPTEKIVRKNILERHDHAGNNVHGGRALVQEDGITRGSGIEWEIVGMYWKWGHRYAFKKKWRRAEKRRGAKKAQKEEVQCGRSRSTAGIQPVQLPVSQPLIQPTIRMSEPSAHRPVSQTRSQSASPLVRLVAAELSAAHVRIYGPCLSQGSKVKRQKAGSRRHFLKSEFYDLSQPGE